MGIVERYQKQSDRDDDMKVGQILIPPPPLSLDLARNEGIGDVLPRWLLLFERLLPNNTGIVTLSGKKKRRS